MKKEYPERYSWSKNLSVSMLGICLGVHLDISIHLNDNWRNFFLVYLSEVCLVDPWKSWLREEGRKGGAKQVEGPVHQPILPIKSVQS